MVVTYGCDHDLLLLSYVKDETNAANLIFSALILYFILQKDQRNI